MSDAAAYITTMQRHGDWKFTTVADGYIEGSVQNKRKISFGQDEDKQSFIKTCQVASQIK